MQQNQRKLALLIGLLSLLALLAAKEISAETVTIQAPSNGAVTEFTLSPEDTTTEVLFYFDSFGNETRNFEAAFKGPPGVRVSLDGGQLRSATRKAPRRPLTSGELLETGFFSNVFILHKDSCSRIKRYRVTLRVNLSEISPALRSESLSLKASFKERPYRGPRAASIKPFSDGQFAPQPLLLMSSIAVFFDGYDSILQTHWRRGRLSHTKPIKIHDYVTYKNLLLTRSTIGDLLTGHGSATFAIITPTFSYSTCFKLQRIRQYRNRYPE